MSAKLYRRRHTDQRTPILDRAPVIPLQVIPEKMQAEIAQAADRCQSIVQTLGTTDKDTAVAEFDRKAKQDEVLNKRGGK